MNVGSVLGGILKTVLLAALAAVGVKLGDPTTFAGLGAFAAIGVAVGLFLASVIAKFIASQGGVVGAFRAFTRFAA